MKSRTQNYAHSSQGLSVPCFAFELETSSRSLLFQFISILSVRFGQSDRPADPAVAQSSGTAGVASSAAAVSSSASSSTLAPDSSQIVVTGTTSSVNAAASSSSLVPVARTSIPNLQQQQLLLQQQLNKLSDHSGVYCSIVIDSRISIVATDSDVFGVFGFTYDFFCLAINIFHSLIVI